jgi:uncharacterized protein YjbI with pentapeptide repeats
MDSHNVRKGLSVQDADMTESSFVNTKLTKSRFDDVNLQNSTFTNVNLAGVAYVDVNLRGASIANANLTGMTVDGIPIDDMLRAYRHREKRRDGPSGAVLYVKDVTRLRQFYQHVVGFKVQHAARDHVVLASPAFQLVLVEVPSSIASSIDVTEPPRLRTESPTKLSFATADIAAVRVAAPQYGGGVLPRESEWDFDGARVCDGNDPEGNVFQLREARVGLTPAAGQ